MAHVNGHQTSVDDDVKYLISSLAVVPDFPKPGIIFRDTLSLFNNPLAFQKVINLFAGHIQSLNVDAIVGLEARGFILGGAIAYKLNLPFVPIRKVFFNEKVHEHISKNWKKKPAMSKTHNLTPFHQLSRLNT